MPDYSSMLTAKQAALLADCTARHINNLITRGKLSAKKIDNKYYIEKSEFFRLFPESFKKEQAGSEEGLKSEIERMQLESNMLKSMCSQKEREIEFLRKQLEVSNNEKHQMLEAITHHSRLLEYNKGTYKSAKGSWLNIFKNK